MIAPPQTQPARPIEHIDGYLPIEDHGLVGDGTTAALVGRDGAVSWLCVPRFDGEALFARILDRHDGGVFELAPEGVTESRQHYVEDTGVLVTELYTADGMVEITDALPLRRGAHLVELCEAGRAQMLRRARVRHGHVRLRYAVDPRGGAQAEPGGGGLRLRWPLMPDLPLHLSANRPLPGTHGVFELSQGDEVAFVLDWGGGARRFRPLDADDLLDATVRAWREWVRALAYDGHEEPMVRRSALTLKLLDYFANGSIIAAPTSSLPEQIGGLRNWDYRYAWVRDAAYSVYALRRVGLAAEGDAFLGWALDAAEQGGRPCVLYTIDAEQPPPERLDRSLAGYRSSAPVRWGNAAADQRQHDVYGEILDCAYQWMAGGGEVDEPLWARLRELVDAAGREWDQPDHGIWEVRTPGRPFTYSTGMCHVALDRGARMARRLGLPASGPWEETAAHVADVIVNEAWNEELGSFAEHIDGSGGLDASLLALPLRRVVPADHPRMAATAEAIVRELGAGDGLLYRYLPQESPDGLPGHEGAFLLCSFWMVDNLAGQGRLDEAADLYERLCARANPLGLLPEQIDPGTGRFLGNFPQAFSHVGVISSGMNLARSIRSARGA